MFQNRLMNIAVMLMIVIAIVGITVLVLFKVFFTSPASADSKPKEMTAQEAAAALYMVDKITTNLQDSGVIQVQMGLQADSDKTKSELEIRKVQIADAINSILENTTVADLKKQGGYDRLKQQIMDSINKILSKGKVTKVLFNNIVIG